MFKKFLILLLIIGAVVAASIPWWSSRMADQAFNDPGAPAADEMARKAIQIKLYILSYANAREIAEKSIIYFPESKYLPNFLYSAGMCAEKEREPEVAIHWYTRFLEIFPEHELAQMAENSLNKLKNLHD